MADNNMFSPLFSSLDECSKVLFKSIKKALNINTLDFKKLFEELNLCNKSKEYPKLYKTINEEYFKAYQFTLPVGLSIDDFKKNINAIHLHNYFVFRQLFLRKNYYF